MFEYLMKPITKPIANPFGRRVIITHPHKPNFKKIDTERCIQFHALRDHCVPFFEDFEKKFIKKVKQDNYTEVASYNHKPEGERSPDCKLFCLLMRESTKKYCGKYKLQLTAFILCKTLKLLNKQCEDAEIYQDDLLKNAIIDETAIFAKTKNILLQEFCAQINKNVAQCSDGQKDFCESLEIFKLFCADIPKINDKPQSVSKILKNYFF
jgi:hypothetical protein